MENTARWIPWALISFFATFMALLIGFAWIAFHTYTGEVTVDAYKKGLAYNAIIAESEAQKQLGWKSKLEAIPQGRSITIAFTLMDAKGKPIDHASVTARLFRPTQAGHDAQVALQGEQGIYYGKADLNWPGQWELRVSASKDGHSFQQSKTIILQ